MALFTYGARGAFNKIRCVIGEKYFVILYLRIPIKFEMFEDTKNCSRTTDGLNVTCPGNSCHQEGFQATSGLEPGKVTKYVDFKL